MKKTIRQFLSYFAVGLAAALMEWGTFGVCNSMLSLGVYLSTTIAFCAATLLNWVLGRAFTFKEKAAERKPARDMASIFLVSGVGYLFNLLLMWLLADKLSIMPLLAKVLATGIVFFWNFLSRKYIVYRERSV